MNLDFIPYRSKLITTTLYFDSGDAIDLVGMYYNAGLQYFEIKHRGDLTERPLPYGDWQNNCDKPMIFFKNGVITAHCSVVKWNSKNDDDIAAYSTLDVDNSCMLGSSLKINKVTAKLECEHPK